MRSPPIPADARSRTTVFGALTVAQIRTLEQFTRNTSREMQFDVCLIADNLREGGSRRIVIVTFESGIKIELDEDGKWKPAE